MAYLDNLINILDSAGDKEVIVVCDFDGTITSADSDVTMNAMAKYLGYDSEFAKERTALYNEYGKYLTDGDENERYKKLNKWWTSQMQLFKKYNVSPDAFMDAVSKLNFTLHDGAYDLLAYCEKQDIPVFIISSGLGNLIIPILAMSGCLSMNMRVIANFVRYDGDTPVSYTPVVTPMNKGAHLTLELEEFENYYALVIGNKEEDITLLPEDISTGLLVED